MAAFAFTARSASGQTRRGVRAGASATALARDLAGEGLFLVRAEPARSAPRPRARLKPPDRAALLLHLAAYLEGGIPLLAALEDYRDPGRPAVADLAARVAEGVPLSAAMAAHPGLFQPVHLAMVRAGEATGRLDRALRAVLRLVEWDSGLRARVRKAAAYPLTVLAVLALVGGVAGALSLPPILAMLEDLGVELPLVTRAFLALGHALVGYGWILPLLGAGLWAGFRQAMARPGPRLRWDSLKLALPVAGRLAQRTALARFAHVLAAQQSAGIPLVEALRACEGVTGNARIGQAVAAMRAGVEQGRGLAAAAARTGQFPPLVLRMLGVGEAAGNLEEAMAKVAARFDAEAAESVQRLFALLDPAVKVLLAGLLVFVASALLVPLYLLAGSLNG